MSSVLLLCYHRYCLFTCNKIFNFMKNFRCKNTFCINTIQSWSNLNLYKEHCQQASWKKINVWHSKTPQVWPRACLTQLFTSVGKGGGCKLACFRSVCSAYLALHSLPPIALVKIFIELAQANISLYGPCHDFATWGFHSKSFHLGKLYVGIRLVRSSLEGTNALV